MAVARERNLAPEAGGGGRAWGGMTEARLEAAERRRLEQDLRQAVAEGGFVLHYQPRFVLQSGVMRAAEALIRWPHRKRGLVPPSTFIPLAERSELIDTIGGWVLHSACRDAARWAELTAEPPNVSVNVSARQLQDGVLLTQLAAALEQSALPPERLELELTETVLADSSVETLLTLCAIRDLGVGLALDDFGTGYASLFTLKRLPLTALKLDRSLVRDLPQAAEDAAIVRAIIDTGHALDVTLIAEGIETEEQRAFLAGAGCDEGQGYLFSPSIPPEKLRTRISSTEAPEGSAEPAR